MPGERSHERHRQSDGAHGQADLDFGGVEKALEKRQQMVACNTRSETCRRPQSSWAKMASSNDFSGRDIRAAGVTMHS